MIDSFLAVEFSKKLVTKKEYVKQTQKINKNLSLTTIDVKNNTCGYEQGLYKLLTLPFDPVLQSLEKQNITKTLVDMLSQILEYSNIKKPKSALIVGLGNPDITADKFGAKVVDKVFAVVPNMAKSGLCLVSKISPNVFGATGLESYDVVKGVIDSIKPNVVILIDTLVASSAKRLCTNIQMANVGVVPGSGVNNSRKILSQNSLGTKVITIGVPFVLFATDLVQSDIGNLTKQQIVKSKRLKNLVIMPREIDEQLKFTSSVVASAINTVLNPTLTANVLDTFLCKLN